MSNFDLQMRVLIDSGAENGMIIYEALVNLPQNCDYNSPNNFTALDA
jgi:hypothetical protein